jgi:hypothetical protein
MMTMALPVCTPFLPNFPRKFPGLRHFFQQLITNQDFGAISHPPANIGQKPEHESGGYNQSRPNQYSKDRQDYREDDARP